MSLSRTSKFLKLKTAILNTDKIIGIDCNPDKYVFHMDIHDFNGFFMFGCGGMDNNYKKWIVYKSTEPEDYDAVEKWIDEIAKSCLTKNDL